MTNKMPIPGPVFHMSPALAPPSHAGRDSGHRINARFDLMFKFKEISSGEIEILSGEVESQSSLDSLNISQKRY